MAIKVTKPVIRQFTFPKELEEKWGDGETSGFIAIRQARYGDNAKRNSALSTYTRKITEEGATLESKLDLVSLFAEEIRLTLADCNIEDENGRPLFRFKNNRIAMSREAFLNALDMLPDDVVKFIHDKVIEVNPQWGLEGE